MNTPSSATLRLRVNGQDLAVPAGESIASLIQRLDLGAFRLAVERNRRVVPRQDHASTQLEDGDQIEIVTFVGGG